MYEYDIFISYRRNEEAVGWITNHLIPLVQLRLEMELGYTPKVFLDEQIELGATWPLALGQALGRSKTLLVLWSKNYLASPWCLQELGMMLRREQATGLRSVSNPRGLVIPVFIHDGEAFPADLQHIQHIDIKKCFNVRMVRDGARAEELDATLATHAPAIAECIENAPPWDATWPIGAADAFKEKFEAAIASQTAVPRFTSS